MMRFDKTASVEPTPERKQELVAHIAQDIEEFGWGPYEYKHAGREYTLLRGRTGNWVCYIRLPEGDTLLESRECKEDADVTKVLKELTRGFSPSVKVEWAPSEYYTGRRRAAILLSAAVPPDDVFAGFISPDGTTPYSEHESMKMFSSEATYKGFAWARDAAQQVVEDLDEFVSRGNIRLSRRVATSRIKKLVQAGVV